jgi:hypothetical protein
LGPGFDASDDPEKSKCRFLHLVTGDLDQGSAFA